MWCEECGFEARGWTFQTLCPVCRERAEKARGEVHHPCCNSPTDMGHMNGCPNSPENDPG